MLLFVFPFIFLRETLFHVADVAECSGLDNQRVNF